MASTFLLLSLISILVHQISSQAPEPRYTFWEYAHFDSEYDLANWTTKNAQPIGAFNNKKIRIGGNDGYIYHTKGVNTIGYQHISLEFQLSYSKLDPLENGEVATVAYSIDSQIKNWTKIATYNKKELYPYIKTSIELPSNANNNIGVRIGFENSGNSEIYDAFYISHMLRLTGTKITLTPTNEPTNEPSIEPTIEPTMPTMEPTIEPTIPTLEPTQYPTSEWTNNPTLEPTISPTPHPTFVLVSMNDSKWITSQYIILCVVTMTFIMSLIILTVCNFSKSEGLLIMKRIRMVALFQMIAFFMSYLFWMVCILMVKNQLNESDLNIKYYFVIGLQYVFWIIGWICFYILLVYKLYHTFRDSEYKMSKTFMCFHFFIAFIFIPVWYSLVTAAEELSIVSENGYFILSGLGSVFIIFGMLTLIISFNRNLFIIIAMQQREHAFSANIMSRNHQYYSLFDDDNNDNDNDNIFLDDVQTSMLNVVTKQTLLGSIMLLDSVLYLFAVLIISIFKQTEKESTEWIIYEYFLSIFININMLCIYFGWKMSLKEYDICCGKCHSKLIALCQSLVKKKIRANINVNTRFHSFSID